MKTASELIDDHQNYQRCMREAQNFDRSRAWSCLQDMYAHYQRQISVYGTLFDGTYVVRNVAPNMYSDAELIRQLVYIAKHIVHSSDSIYRYYRQMTKISFKSVPGEKTELAPGLPAESLQPATQPLRTLLIFTSVADEGKAPEFLPFFQQKTTFT